jgi:hypothetical protein
MKHCFISRTTIPAEDSASSRHPWAAKCFVMHRVGWLVEYFPAAKSSSTQRLYRPTY